jgi:multidrug efflux pump subunit AcrA (membrane-fusion protein)
LLLADTKFQGTKRLFDKGFVTKSEVENDQVNADKGRLKVDSSKTALDLFIKYEFIKTSEETVSKYDEALRGLERTRKEAVSKLAQARAKLKGAEGRYSGERKRLDQLREQIEKCTITAKFPGLVVYGNPNDPPWRSEERIRVGASIWERTTILTIPDMTKMGVKLGIHESHIKKVTKGLKAKITADAFPNDPLQGEVMKVAVIPDGNRWFNPDSKTYQTTIQLSASREWLKPGMSAKVEIQVKQLPDVVYVPLQAVSQREGKQVVYQPGSPPVLRQVEVGEYNDEFIEIKKGLAAGDIVLLRPPDEERQAGEDTSKAAADSKPAKPVSTP